MGKETAKACGACDGGRLHKGVRDVTVTRGGLSAAVKNVSGCFCDSCDEIEFDDATDSARRYAEAGDGLVLRNRANLAE